MNPTKLAQLQKQQSNARTGGKGTMRRKKKVVRKNQVTDDKRLQQTIKRLGSQQIREADEVLFYKNDGQVLVVRNAKLQAAVNSNAYVFLSGRCCPWSRPPLGIAFSPPSPPPRGRARLDRRPVSPEIVARIYDTSLAPR